MSDRTRPDVLVAGATGIVGGTVATSLLSAGKTVRALSRNPCGVQRLAAEGAEVVRGDLRDPASLRAACTGVRQVFTTVHSFLGRGASAPQEVDGNGNRNLIDAAKAAGVEHFVFTSVRASSAFDSVDFFRCKHETERYLRDSGVDFTILRPTVFMDTWVPMIGGPLLDKGKATIFGPGHAPINLVAAADVAEFALLALAERHARNQVIDVGGPENLSLLEVAETVERVAGRTGKKQHVPIAVMRLMAPLLRPFNPIVARQIHTALLMNTTEQSLDMTATLARYPVSLTPLEDWVRSHYGAARATAVRD